LAPQIDDLRRSTDAGIVLTKDYGLASWLAFYLPSHPPVEQITERMRWVDAPAPDPKLFQGPMLFVCSNPCSWDLELPKLFNAVERLAVLPRQRRGVTIEQYLIYRVADPRGPVLEEP
jgi:hypothetical protein